MNNNQIYDKRQQPVIKSNKLIQEARYNLSLEQQRILLYLISQIKPDASSFEPMQLNILEFCEIAGIRGKKYAAIKNEIKSLADCSFWFETETGEKLKHWLSSEHEPEIKRGSGTITLCLSNSLKEYLLELRSHFTKYQLEWVLAFKHKYSIRLYEYICSRHFNTLEPYTFRMQVDELKSILSADTYSRFSKFNEKVLSPSVEEINEFSDKNIVCTFEKKGKAIDYVSITVSNKEPFEMLATEHQINRRLGLPEGETTLLEEINTRLDEKERNCNTYEE